MSSTHSKVFYSIGNVEVFKLNNTISYYNVTIIIFFIHNNIFMIKFFVISLINIMFVIGGEESVITTVMYNASIIKTDQYICIRFSRIFIFYVKIQSCVSPSFLAKSGALPLTHLLYCFGG
jgi:hypothetical protein